MTERPSHSGVLVSEAAVVLMALIWGVNYSVVKYGTSVLSPLAFNGIRVAIAASALGVVAFRWGGPRPATRDVLTLLALGAFGNGVYQVLFVEGIARTRAGEAAIVVGASPALIALAGWLLRVERVNARGVAGIGLSIFGVALVVLGRASSGAGPQGGSLTGDLLVLAGSVCWAVYAVLLVPFTQRISGFHIVAISMTGGAAVVVAAGGRELASTAWRAVPGSAWAAILYGSLGALVIAYILWYRGVKVLGPTRTALFGNLQPLIALVVAWLTLHETPRVWQVIGALTIVSGVLLTRVPASEPS